VEDYKKREKDVTARLIARAQILCGGQDVLALRLGVAPGRIAEWIAGKSAPSNPEFQTVIGLILDAHDGREPNSGWRAVDEVVNDPPSSPAPSATA
jgi:hypothetical protein